MEKVSEGDCERRRHEVQNSVNRRFVHAEQELSKLQESIMTKGTIKYMISAISFAGLALFSAVVTYITYENTNLAEQHEKEEDEIKQEIKEMRVEIKSVSIDIAQIKGLLLNPGTKIKYEKIKTIR